MLSADADQPTKDIFYFSYFDHWEMGDFYLVTARSANQLLEVKIMIELNLASYSPSLKWQTVR